MKAQIEQIINEKILPVLASHGGSLELLEVTTDNMITVKLTGACSTCPGRQQTIEQFVEATIKEDLPEIKGVILNNQVDDELIAQALEILRGNK